MTTPALLNPDRLVPDELALQLGPFGSWPKDGSLPVSHFSEKRLEGANKFYREEGYLVLHHALESVELENLKAETRNLCRNQDGAIDGIPPAPQEMSDEAAMESVLCVHFPHKLSSRILTTLSHPRIIEVLKMLLEPNIKCMQSMLFVKAAGKPGQAWHQDEDFIPTRDRSLIGAWIALDEQPLRTDVYGFFPVLMSVVSCGRSGNTSIAASIARTSPGTSRGRTLLRSRSRCRQVPSSFSMGICCIVRCLTEVNVIFAGRW